MLGLFEGILDNDGVDVGIDDGADESDSDGVDVG